MPTARDRDALYYPYIHIRDVNWLKAALLCFPRVRRMVPRGFTLNDSPGIRPFATLRLDGKPLLVEEDTFSPQIETAYGSFVSKIEAELDFFRDQFAGPEVKICHRDSFRMHSGKMSEHLLSVFERHGLAWPLDDPTWYAMHPKLGEAVMSVLAIATARRWGMDIVTSDPDIHHALATQDPDQVFEHLIGRAAQAQPPSREEVTDELALLLMSTAFDLDRLTPEAILELKKEGKDLRAFKDRLAEIAGRIPDVPDPADRSTVLKPYAEQIVREWKAYRRSLPGFAADALVASAVQELPVVALGKMGGFWLGLPFGIGIALHGGYQIWRSFRKEIESPYQYLSSIERAGAVRREVKSAAVFLPRVA